MPMTSASRPVTLRKMMRRVRLEKLTRTNRCQLWRKQRGKPASPAFLDRQRTFVGPFGLDVGLEAFRRSIEHG